MFVLVILSFYFFINVRNKIYLTHKCRCPSNFNRYLNVLMDSYTSIEV